MDRPDEIKNLSLGGLVFKAGGVCMSLNTFVLIFPTECERLRGLGVYIHQYLCWSSQLNGKFYAGGNLNSSIPVLVFPLECKFYGSESLYSSIPVLILRTFTAKFWEFVFLNTCVGLPNWMSTFPGVGVYIPQYPCWSVQLNVKFYGGGSLYSAKFNATFFLGWEFRFLNIVVECCWSSQLNVEFNCCPWSWAGCVLV